MKKSFALIFGAIAVIFALAGFGLYSFSQKTPAQESVQSPAFSDEVSPRPLMTAKGHPQSGPTAATASRIVRPARQHENSTDSLSGNSEASLSKTKTKAELPEAPNSAPMILQEPAVPQYSGGIAHAGGVSSNLSQTSQNPATPSGTVQGSDLVAVEQELAVPPGAIAPAALYDDDPKTPQQEAALERILNEFQETVTSDVGQSLTQAELWEAARLQADRRYLTLFGWQAYNARHLQSAKEAVAEKRTLPGPN